MATAIPKNRAAFSLPELLAATSAVVTGKSERTGCVGVTTDSRDDVEGKLFVALSGERFDGHKYVADVLSRGAFAALVQEDVPVATSGLKLRVPSTLTALGALAHAHRVRWGGRVVTIGGSAGKTTTRSAVQAFLSALLPGKVGGTIGNLNNLVGVPMTLLAIEPSCELAVVEVGTNQRGEVDQLSSICEANIALLTCIGLEHSEGLGDLDGIEEEESALFRHLARGAQVVGLVDDPRVMRQLAAFDSNVCWTYGLGEAATHRIVDRDLSERECTQLRIERKRTKNEKNLTLRTRLFGLPGALASAAALTVADALNVTVESSVALGALDRQVGEAGRLRVLERSDRALIIDDCYNANPISMRSSFGVARELARTESRRLLFVLGDMRELGEHSTREHLALADELEGVAEVIAVGSEMVAFANRARELGQTVQHFVDADAAKSRVAEMVQPSDVVLVKGSRGVALERVVTVLTGGEGRCP
jgi:UDP-N-acetylmuramoyl-tripeptide--D-alanyl-D-alanine ligase